MKLEYVEGLSRPGDPAKPNDDAFSHAPEIAAVFDGATNLGEPILPVDSDAAWIARKGAEGIIAHREAGAREALRLTAADAEREFAALRLRAPHENYELPLSSMMLAAPRDGGLEFLWFGDCGALVRRLGERVEVVGDAFESRAAESRRVAKLSAEKGLAPTAGVDSPEYLKALRAGRNKVTTRDDRWAFCPMARCADFAASKFVRTPPGTDLLLFTDGFLALASDYGRYDADAFLAAALSRGLRPLVDELRAIETGDPGGRRYPRFKVSDDATALLMRVVENG